MKQDKLVDRRRYPRWKVSVPVREIQPEAHLLCATSIGPGGLFCPDAVAHEKGSQVLLEVDLLTDEGPFVVSGTVAYSGAGAGGTGIGVAFTSPRSDLRAFFSDTAPMPTT